MQKKSYKNRELLLIKRRIFLSPERILKHETRSLCFPISLAWLYAPRATFQGWQPTGQTAGHRLSDHSQSMKYRRNVLGLESRAAHLLQPSTVTSNNHLSFCWFWAACKITPQGRERHVFLLSAEADHRDKTMLNSFQDRGTQHQSCSTNDIVNNFSLPVQD